MTLHQPLPSQQTSRPPRFINSVSTVESLEHALQHLEDILRQRGVDGHDGIKGLLGGWEYSFVHLVGGRRIRRWGYGGGDTDSIGGDYAASSDADLE